MKSFITVAKQFGVEGYKNVNEVKMDREYLEEVVGVDVNRMLNILGVNDYSPEEKTREVKAQLEEAQKALEAIKGHSEGSYKAIQLAIDLLGC